MTVSERIKGFVDRLDASRVASQSDLAGCSLEEIARLEFKYSVRLPDSYSLFLNVMGRRAGALVDVNEFDFYYPEVLELTEQRRRLCSEVREEEPDAVIVELPAQSLIVCGRYGEQFWFINCNHVEDSPVFYFNTWDNEIRQVEESLFGFLEAMRMDTVHWIERGMRSAE